MNAYIVLFRGINVGGNNGLPMKDLKTLLERHGGVDVRTYIQSGNAVMRSRVLDAASLAKRLTAAVSKRHGFEPRVLVLTRAELEKAVAGNPFPQADDHPTTLHLFFLDGRPTRPDLKQLQALRAGEEEFALKGSMFYLYTPDGFGRSKLAARAEKLLGIDATARNWRTVTKLLEMARLLCMFPPTQPKRR